MILLKDMIDNKTLRKAVYITASILFFLTISYGFVPEVFSGKVVNQSDIAGFRGMSREADTWNTAHPDDKTAWTNSMFGGMPTIMITGNDKGDLTKVIFDVLQTGFRPASYFFISLFGGWLLFLALGTSFLTAVAGAVAITFCSYNFQIIQVGHNSKMLAMAFAPWVLAAFIFCYKQTLKEIKCKKEWFLKTLTGAVLFAFAVSFQIKANHIQISFYLLIILIIYSLTVFFFILFKRRDKIVRFLTASVLLLSVGGIGIATNADHLIPAYEYSHHTMRGGSELAGGNGSKKEGLDIGYATAWSYGWNELPNLLVPRYNGGSSSGELSLSSHSVKLLQRYGRQDILETSKHMPLYWGPQPFTAGPMYLGAITIFLFVTGLLLYRKKEKWWLLISSLIAICLGVGSHFMTFTEFWFEYVPMYNKFRTVSMALIILQYTMPVLGFLCLESILDKSYTKREILQKTFIAFIVTGGFCLLAYLFPGIAGNFSGNSDSSLPDILVSALQEDRRELLQADAIKSFLFISITFLVVNLGFLSVNKEKYKLSVKTMTTGFICLLVILNLGSEGKKYLNSEHFVSKESFDKGVSLRPADEKILSDTGIFRVLDLTRNVFNDSQTSFYHKSIGGYSPVKLQRYQDLIDYHIMPQINGIIKKINDGEKDITKDAGIINMLNTKYIILGENNFYKNEHAFGDCMLIKEVVKAETPKEEIELVGKYDLKETAIVGKDFANMATDSEIGENDTITLISHTPNEIKYKYSTKGNRTAVFSEIYYPDGWKACLEDGRKLELFRCDWTFRAVNLPPGEHTITMRFDPESYVTGQKISLACSSLLILILLINCVLIGIINKKHCCCH